MYITLEKESEDKLSKTVFRFWFKNTATGMSLCLDTYLEQSRPTTRHKYRTDRNWERLDGRHNTIPDAEIRDSVMSSDIIIQVKERLKTSIDKVLIDF